MSETLHLNIYVKYHACIKPLQKNLLNGYVNVMHLAVLPASVHIISVLNA